MPTVTLDKQEVLKHIGKNYSDKYLEDRIPLLGVDLEKIGKDEITVEIFPNRPDMMDEAGFGRALRSFFGNKTGLNNYQVTNTQEKVIVDKNLKNIRPYTAVAIVKNLKFDDEKIKQIVQLQEKLHVTYGRNRKRCAIGIYPFENIKTPIRFTGMNPRDIVFKPLDSRKEMNGNEILAKHPKGKEYGYLLKDYKKLPVFIDAKNHFLSLTPVINSEYTGRVNEKTKDVFVEVSGNDYEICKKCLQIIVCSLAELGGNVYSMELIYPDKRLVSPNLEPEKMLLDYDYVNKIIGVNFSKLEIKKYLAKMGYGIQGKNVLIPNYRTDILHLMDVAEDVAIGYGYDRMKEEIPKVSTIAKEDKYEIFKNKVADIFTGLRLLESYTFTLSNEKHLVDYMDNPGSIISLKNSQTSDYSVLRNWVLPSMLKVLQENKHHEYPQNLFEMGKIFSKGSGETGVKESDNLCVVLCHGKANFTEVRQILDSLMDSLGIGIMIKETEHGSFISGRVGDVYVKNKKLGVIGEIHPKVLTNWDLDMPVSSFELDMKVLYSLLN